MMISKVSYASVFACALVMSGLAKADVSQEINVEGVELTSSIDTLETSDQMTIPEETETAEEIARDPDCGDLRSEVLKLEVCRKVNRQRAARGLKALKVDAGMSRVAQLHAEDMFRRGYFSHVSPNGDTMGDRMRRGNVKFGWAGENIARGQRDSEEVMNAWMNSSGHRANILRTQYRRIGVGYVGKVWVQVFAG